MSDLLNLIVINLFELIAAIVGTIYISKYRVEKPTRYFVSFLWFNVFVEIVFGWLPTFIENFKFFSLLEDTIFVQNLWIYNIYDIISFTFYLYYFTILIESELSRKIAKGFIVVFLICAILNLSFSGVFFETNSTFNAIFGTLLLVLYIIYFYFQMLQSEKILEFYKSFPFYVSVGALVFHLIVNPIFIYEQYYSHSVSSEFVRVFLTILTIVNIFMYSCYTIGFLVCYKKNNSYKRSRSYS